MKKDEVILNFYFREITDVSLETKIQEWLAGDYFREEKEEVLRGIWDARVKFAPKPDRYALESLDRMRVRLGFLRPLPMERRRISVRKAVAGMAGVLFLMLAVGGYLYLNRTESTPSSPLYQSATNEWGDCLCISLPDCTPNEQPFFDRTDGRLAIRQIDPDDIASSPDQDLFPENASLWEVFNRMTAYCSVQFAIDERLPLDMTVRARFERDEYLEEILYIVKNTMRFFDYTVGGDQVILESR